MPTRTPNQADVFAVTQLLSSTSTMTDVVSSGSGTSVSAPPPPPPSPAPAALPLALQSASPPVNPAQVQAAISFLTNPKVQSSPPSRKFSFLESKGLTPHEILEALQRSSSGSREYQVLSGALQNGDQRKASEIVASLDSESGSTSTPPVTTAATASAPQSYSTPSQPTYTYQAPHQQQQPVLYAIQQPNGQVLYSTTPPAPNSNKAGGGGWLATTAAVGAIAGTGALANYLYQKYMPTIRIESRHHYHDQHPSISDATQQQQSAAVHQLMQANGAPAAAGASKMNGISSDNDRYGLTTLNSNVNASNNNDDDQTYRAVTALKNDMRDVVDLLREQTTDIKRALNTIQLSLEVVSRRSREKDSNTVELNETLTGIRSLLQRHQSQILGDNSNGSSSSVSSSSSLLPASHNRSATTSNFPLSSISEKWNGSTHSRSESMGATPAGLNGDEDGGSSKRSNVSVSPEPSNEPSPAERLADGEKAMNDALEEIQADNSSDEQRMAVQAMLLYIGNILSHMDGADRTKYRRIMLSNTAYNSRVRRIKGAERFLLAAGWEVRGSFIEWTDEKRNGGGDGEAQKEEWKEKLLQRALDRLTQCK